MTVLTMSARAGACPDGVGGPAGIATGAQKALKSYARFWVMA
jgi:hypothetical protein